MILLGLGSNLGNRKRYLMQAIEALNAHGDIVVEKVSSLYETEPYGMKEQADFLNLVLQIQTKISPERLLQACQEIELQLGRKRELHWGPRVIDIDLLIYHEERINTDTLILPHPYLALRRFVLVPMAEISCGKYIFDEVTAEKLLELCPDTSNVTLYLG